MPVLRLRRKQSRRVQTESIEAYCIVCGEHLCGHAAFGRTYEREALCLLSAPCPGCLQRAYEAGQRGELKALLTMAHEAGCVLSRQRETEQTLKPVVVA